MEQDIKVGSAGSVAVKEEIAGESVSGILALGPVKLNVTASIDNRALLELAASKVPGGLAHEAIIALENALFPKV